MQRCRSLAPKAVLTIDGTYKILLGVLYQAKHGQRHHDRDTLNTYAPNLHCALNVACSRSILLVKAFASEALEHQLAALREACGETGCESVRVIASDAPEILDDRSTYQQHSSLECVIKDLTHIPLKIEEATGKHISAMSALFRICVKKLRQGLDLEGPFYKKGLRKPTVASLAALISSMSSAVAQQKYTQLQEPLYATQAYTSIDNLIEDVAAICKKYPTMMGRSTGKRSTVRSSLVDAFSKGKVGYIINYGLFVARNRDVDMPTGTTANEAFANQLKTWFRNVLFQTGRNANIVLAIATLAKLIAGESHVPACTSYSLQEHEALRRILRAWAGSSTALSSRIDTRTVANPQVDASSLPAGVTVIRKRPANSLSPAATVAKRPAMHG